MKIKHLLKLALILTGIWQLVFSLGLFTNFFGTFQMNGVHSFLSVGFFSLIYYLAIMYLLLFQSELILRLIRVSPEFLESEVSFAEADLQVLVQGVLITAAIWLIVFNISSVMINGFALIRKTNEVNAVYENSTELRWLLSHIVSITIGLLLLRNHLRLAQWIVKQNDSRQN